jgi:hypothetical protein
MLFVFVHMSVCLQTQLHTRCRNIVVHACRVNDAPQEVETVDDTRDGDHIAEAIIPNDRRVEPQVWRNLTIKCHGRVCSCVCLYLSCFLVCVSLSVSGVCVCVCVFMCSCVKCVSVCVFECVSVSGVSVCISVCVLVCVCCVCVFVSLCVC